MPVLKWQMEIQNHSITGGKVLDIVGRGQTSGGVYIDVRESETGSAARFIIKYSVNIGGKDYLLMHEENDSPDELTSARVLDKQCLSCMDRDRFSSLFNALTTYVESNSYTSPEVLAKVLGEFKLCD
jgi:hypothetical protein